MKRSKVTVQDHFPSLKTEIIDPPVLSVLWLCLESEHSVSYAKQSLKSSGSDCSLSACWLRILGHAKQRVPCEDWCADWYESSLGTHAKLWKMLSPGFVPKIRTGRFPTPLNKSHLPTMNGCCAQADLIRKAYMYMSIGTFSPVAAKII